MRCDLAGLKRIDPDKDGSCSRFSMDISNTPRFLFSAQGFYYLVTGLWPLFGMRSFMALTGPKTDLWLVNTVGLLLGVIGAVLAVTGLRRRFSDELVLLAVGSSCVLAGVDIFYAVTGVISGVYLLDALLEIGIIILWAVVGVRRARPSRR